MGELRGGADQPDPGHRPDRPGQHAPAAGRDVGAVRTRIEPRSRSEYAADLEQPDAEDYERLKRLAKRQDDQQMRVFKAELRQALADPSQLPEGELDDAVEYSDGSAQKFLAASGATSTATSRFPHLDYRVGAQLATCAGP